MSASEVDGYDGSSSKCLRKTTTKAQDKEIKKKNLKKQQNGRLGMFPHKKLRT